VENKAKKYERIKLILSLSENILSFILLATIVFTGTAGWLAGFSQQMVNNPYARLVIFVFLLGLPFFVLGWPFSWYSGFRLEHRYGLSNQTFSAWIWESTKGLLVGMILGLPLLIIFYALLRNFPQTWWFWMATVLFFFSVVIGRIAPQVIFPLFYKFEPLNHPELLGKMTRLADLAGFRVQGIYRFNMSKTTKKANAALTGLGRSRRIIFGDTLLENFSLPEIEAIFAHEVGHVHHRHLLTGIISGTLAAYLQLYLADRFLQPLMRWQEISLISELSVLPLLGLILTLIGLVFMPLTNALSRFHERQADRFALSKAEVPASFRDALEKLAEQNLSDPDPHPLVEWFFHSHPSIKKRLVFADKQLGART